MGSPVSPVVADIYMEHLEEKILAESPTPPRIWLRYVDDTFVIQDSGDISSFTHYINQCDTHIKFTHETEVDGKLAFLDTCVHRGDHGQLTTTVYRKPTHTDQYLDFTSDHPLSTKVGVARTLLTRADKLCSSDSDKAKEKTHVRNALRRCNYPDWVIRKAETSRSRPGRQEETGEQPTAFTTLPYVRGTSEAVGRILNKADIRVAYKPVQKTRDLVVHPKDPMRLKDRAGVVYRVSCGECEASYIGQTGRKLGDRLAEHQNSISRRPETSAVGLHSADTGHEIQWDNAEILGRDSWENRRLIREAIHIKRSDPALNRDRGSYPLPGVLDPLVLSQNQSFHRPPPGGSSGARHAASTRDSADPTNGRQS